jgi:DNA-binding MarR family transcriptional regulator
MDAMKVPLKGAQKAVWLVIAYRAAITDQCWPGLETIAEEAGVTVQTVCRAVLELERVGLISRSSPAGGTSTRYFVHSNVALELTLTSRETKERERNKGECVDVNHAARKELELARSVSRRNGVKDAFYRLVAALPESAVITVPALARELGSRQSQVRSDMNYLIKHRDIPFDILGRFGRSKPNPKNFGRDKQAAILQFRRSAL